MSTPYIYTEKNDCQDCYKCIRECPVKAIKIEGHSASILQEKCIYCGHCTTVCPVKAKKVKEDISKVKYLLQNHKKVLVSLAPSYIAEFPGIAPSQLIAALMQLGFSGISETALGAEIVTRYLQNTLSEMPSGVNVSSCCPGMVELIKKYYPQHTGKLTAVDTPMLAHGKFLKKHYGDVKVVFIGPCIAKKKEADHNPGIIDAAITFSKLRRWFTEEGVQFYDNPDESQKKNQFIPYPAGRGNLYPIEGGMINCLNNVTPGAKLTSLSFSGIKKTMPILNDLDNFEPGEQVFLELMACEGGCVNGPGCTGTRSLAIKNLQVEKTALHAQPHVPFTHNAIDYSNTYNYINAVDMQEYAQFEIEEVLKSIGKQTQKDELNCGGCGYEHCRDFACAVLNQHAEKDMCISYMRKLAQDKANALLQRMPYGVVIADKNLKVVESNRNFATLAGEDVVMAFDAKPGLEGAFLPKLIPYASYFKNFIESDAQSLEKDIRNGKQLLHLSIFTLQGKNLFCGIVHNLRAPELKQEEVVKRTRKVIRQNLETVQKIAFHLGENASNMETLLNSIVDIQGEEGGDDVC